jgi:hypothetical protein
MGKLDSISPNPVMREYAQGAAQSAILPVADFIAPPVEVATSVGQYKSYTEKNRFHIPDTARAIGGPATQLSFEASDLTYNCKPHALDFPVDNLEAIETAQLENMLMEGARAVAEVAALSHEKTVVDAALAAAGAGTDLTLGTDDLVDGLDDQLLAMAKVAKYGSIMNIGIVFGATAFKSWKNDVSVKNRYNGGIRGNQRMISPGIDDVSGLLVGNPDARVTYTVYDANGPGEADSINFVLDNSILVFARNPSPSRRDPSFMKTFRLAGQWMVPGSYMSPDGRVEFAKYDWSEDVKVTNSAAVSRINLV